MQTGGRPVDYVIMGETRKALDTLGTNPVYRTRYADFVAAMVYGEGAEFGYTMATVTASSHRWIGT